MSVETLTKEELEALKDFKARVAPLLEKEPEEHKKDHFLVRYLLARDLDLDKAEEMLKKSLVWIKENGLDRWKELEDIPEKFRKRFMFAYLGEDVNGIPILLFPSGRHDHRIIIEEVGFEECKKWNVVWMGKFLELMENVRQKTGKQVFQFHEIVDMEGYSIRQLSHKPSMDLMKEATKAFDENMPESIKSIICINAPRIFPILYNLMKPMMTKKMLDKISVYGGNEQEWIQVFKDKGFPMELLPPRWGGSLKGDDEFCSQEDCWRDAPIPLRYFKEVEGEDEEGFTTIKVPAREKYKIEILVPEKGTKLEWKFQTEVHDIAFGLTFDLPGAVDVPVGRVPSNKEIQEGKVICGAKGSCIFTFDNRYSLTTVKTLRYRIDLIQPSAK